MAQDRDKGRQQAGETTREARLKAALKANIARRKAQATARKATDAGAAGRPGDEAQGQDQD